MEDLLYEDEYEYYTESEVEADGEEEEDDDDETIKNVPIRSVSRSLGIHSKSGCPGCPDSAENPNFPQKDCLRTQNLSVSVPES